MSTKITMVCLKCNEHTQVDSTVLRQRIKAGLPYTCKSCGADLSKDGVKDLQKGRSDNQKRSKKQEERVAKRLGAQRQKASGSLPGAKGDVRKTGSIRGECKFTRAKSFSLKLAELVKIEIEAELGENPAFFVEFQCQSPPKRYVVLPEWLYEHYARSAGDI